MFELLIAALLTSVAQAPTVSAGADPLASLSGQWQIMHPDDGKVLQDCANAQNFAVSADRKTVTLTELGNKDWSSRYVVLHSENGRVLMFVDGEKRKTEAGDPILWWAYFDGPNSFRWRQYDWAPDNRTTEWRRCPAR